LVHDGPILKKLRAHSKQCTHRGTPFTVVGRGGNRTSSPYGVNDLGIKN